MRSKNKNSLTIKQKIFATVPSALLIVSIIFLFIPFTIYQGNIDEFAVPLTSILCYLLMPALIILFLLVCLGLALPENGHRRYISILFILAILIWIQGNIFVWKYGLMNGQTIDWTTGIWRGWIDAGLWALMLMVGFIFYKQLYKLSGIICTVLIFVQLAHLSFASFNETNVWNKRASALSHESPSKEIFEFSSKQNIIFIILDAFQSDIFQDILNGDSEFYYKALGGFTFFRDTLASFPTTYMSIPAILSGRTYKNRIPMPDFVNEVLNGDTIPNVLYLKGFDIDLVLNNGMYGTGHYSNKYFLPVPYNVKENEYCQSNTALIMDLALFRLAPHFLKKYVSIDGVGLIRSLSGQSDYLKFRYFAHKAFFEDLISRMCVERDRPVYKFIHLCTTHAPFVVNDNCEYAGGPLLHTRRNIINQAKCSLDHVIEFLKKLKSKGIYESSLIIISADHGAGKKTRIKNMNEKVLRGLVLSEQDFQELVGSALPLLLIKPPGSLGPLRVSDAQATLSDIPDTVSSFVGLNKGFGGQSIYDIPAEENRERSFCYYKWRHENWQNDYFERLVEFKVNGSAFDARSWRKGNTYFPPDISDYETKSIDFGKAEAKRFLYSGWGENERSSDDQYTFNWALGDMASMYISIPKNKPSVLEANIATYASTKCQGIVIKVDGDIIGKWRLMVPWKLTKKRITIPANKNRTGVSILEFQFDNHLIPKGKERPVAVLFESIKLRQVANKN